MKIAIITSGLLPVPASKGGAIETLLDSFLQQNEISDKDINITIYSIYDKKAKEIAIRNNYVKTNYKFINNFSNFVIRIINKLLKKNIPINKFYQKKVVRLINNKKFDYVIIENYPELSLNFKKHKVIPYIHSDVFNNEIDNCKNILSSCYKVITVSNYIKNRVVEIDPTQENKVYTVYNSIDFNEISKEEYRNLRNTIRTKYSIFDNDIVYGFLGRLSEEKGALELIEAFNKIDVPNKKLLIIGGIWYHSNKKNDYLRKLEEISGCNIIYTGYVEHINIQNLLCAIDIGVVPSICNEAAGLSVVEFMNTRNIVVASNMGGIPEYLNKEDNFLVEYKGDKEKYINELSKKLKKSYDALIDNEDIINKNSSFSKKFSIEENYKHIVEVLGE